MISMQKAAGRHNPVGVVKRWLVNIFDVCMLKNQVAQGGPLHSMSVIFKL